jgi:hypothetical protein
VQAVQPLAHGHQAVDQQAQEIAAGMVDHRPGGALELHGMRGHEVAQSGQQQGEAGGEFGHCG